MATKNGADLELSWFVVVDADWYEVVRGNLATLRSSGGDYTAAADSCAADNENSTSVLIAGDPLPGDGFWYLVRATNCRGKGTYDAVGSAQIGARDAEIVAGANDCP